jgi:predicted nucleotidyltransferase
VHNLGEKEKLLQSHIKKTLLACRDAIHANFPTAGLVLYGSYARGQAGSESDVDLLVLLDEDVTPANKRTIRDMLYEIGLAADLVISTIIRSYEAWNSPISQATSFYRVVHQEGIQVA